MISSQATTTRILIYYTKWYIKDTFIIEREGEGEGEGDISRFINYCNFKKFHRKRLLLPGAPFIVDKVKSTALSLCGLSR